jgi:hypothetical protein
MTNENVPIHYVCTHEKAKDLVDSHSKFWVSNCGCREGRGGCVDACYFKARGMDGGKLVADKAAC